MVKSLVQPFYEKVSGTCCFVLSCPNTKKAAVIDCVLDYEQASSTTGTDFADTVIEYVKANNLDVEWVMETHAHADHITSGPYVKQALGGTAKTAIGKLITSVQSTFKDIYKTDMDTTGKNFDYLFEAGEKIKLGDLQVEVMHAPGHTPDHIAYHVKDDCLFTGDSMFMPDSGTARCDFPNGSAEQLWETNQKILSLNPDTRIFVGHDYGKNGREPKWETTVKEQKAENIHVKEGQDKASFIEARTTRDNTLSHPRLLIPSIQVNVQGGKFPVDASGAPYIKTPVNALKPGKGVYTA